jgi:NAD(P)-dependent dehydrogenase (short-subunit alcohol dehydrogenase family)
MAELNSGRLAGRVALITGASRGIGAAVARRFAAEGARLILAARTVGGLEEVDDQIRQTGAERATLVPLDVTNGAQIDQLGAAIFERFGRLDVLVANAGVGGTLSPVPHVSPKDWDEVMAVNLTANFRLIRSMDPLLRQSEAGRAIFVTSGAALRPMAYWGPYSASKAALEMLVRVYAAEVEKTPIRANLLDPGVVRTAIRAKAFPGEDPNRVPPPESITDRFVELAEARWTANSERVRAQA